MEDFKKMPTTTSLETYKNKLCQLPRILALGGAILLSGPAIAQAQESRFEEEYAGTAYDGYTDSNGQVERRGYFRPEGATSDKEQPVTLENRELTYEIHLPQDLRRDMEKVIWFALENGAAKKIDRRDLYHCHLLVENEEFERYKGYTGKLTQLIDDMANNYSGLLCHAQEFTPADYGLDQTKRNIAIWKGEEAYIVSSSDTKYNSADVHDVSPRMYSPLALYFDRNPEGEVLLPDGQRLKVVVEGAQLNIRPGIEVDLSEKTQP